MLTIVKYFNTMGFALAQCSALSVAMFCLVKGRRSKKNTIFLLLVSTIISFALLQLKIIMPPFMKLLIINITMIGAWCAIFNHYIGQTIFYSIIVFYELMLCDLVSGNVVALLMQNSIDKIIYNNPDALNTQIVYMLFSTASFAFFCFGLYLTVKYFKSKTLSIGNRHWISVDIILFFCYVISLLFMNINSLVSTQGLTFFALLVWGGFALVSILIVKLFTNLCFYFQTESSRMMIETKNKALEEQLHLQTSAIKEMRIFRHDISNHLNSIAFLLSSKKYSKAQEYLADIAIKIDSKKSIVYCANDTINAVLNLIRIGCEASNIGFNIYLESDYTISISSTDLTAILFNLLNNSVEALSKSTVNEKKAIYVQIGKYNAYDCFVVKNNFENVLQASDGTFLTTKGDSKLHGYGLKSVSETANKYGGNLHIDISDNTFKATVLLKTK